MKFDKGSLDISAGKGRKYLKVGFSDSLEWLKQKVVSNKISPEPFQVSSQRVKKLTSTLEKELLKLNQGFNDAFVMQNYSLKPQKNFYLKNPKKWLRSLQKVLHL